MRLHVDGLAAHSALVLGRADFNAEAATGAVLHGDLDGVLLIGQLAPARVAHQETLGRTREVGLTSHLGAYDRVGANQHALAALDADVRVPDGHFLCDVALLPLGGAHGEGAVRGHLADGNRVALAGQHSGGYLLHKVGRHG